MRVLIVGGTGLTGPHIVRRLVADGHDVTVFHRGRTQVELPSNVRVLQGDKADLVSFRTEFASLSPDVVLHTMCVSRADAELFVEAFRGLVMRAVVISSADVYLAYGRLHGTEPGPLVPIPITEDASLRRELSLNGKDYDKVGVEEVLSMASDFRVTILRYPAVYGPGDRLYRFHYFAKRMSDGRAIILLRQTEANWRWTHAYAEDAAWATYLAVTKEPPSHAYNVAEALVPTLHERVQQLAGVMNWQGRILVVPDDALPEHLLPETRLQDLTNFRRMPDYRQDYALDSSRIRRELGYREVVSVEEGLRRTVAWQLEQAIPPDPPRFDYTAEDAVIAALAG